MPLWRRRVVGSEDAKQGTGPRSMVGVLMVSLVLAFVAGIVVYGIFYW